MARIRLIPPDEADGAVAEVYGEIVAHRGPSGVTNIWRVYASSPALLRATWRRLQALTERGSLSRPLRKAINYAVSQANACGR